MSIPTFCGVFADEVSVVKISSHQSHLQNFMEMAGSVRARLQSCRMTIKKVLGFSPCGYLFSFVCGDAAAKAGESE
jgi:hypothetical protein